MAGGGAPDPQPPLPALQTVKHLGRIPGPEERACLEAQARVTLDLDADRHSGPALQAVTTGWIGM